MAADAGAVDAGAALAAGVELSGSSTEVIILFSRGSLQQTVRAIWPHRQPWFWTVSVKHKGGGRAQQEQLALVEAQDANQTLPETHVAPTDTLGRKVWLHHEHQHN